MYHIGRNKMEKISVKPDKFLQRSRHTVNSVKILPTKKDVIRYNEERKVEITNYRHMMFGGEVYDKKLQMRVATDDLIIIV